MPHDLPPYHLPPWPLVYQQMRGWLTAEGFETIVLDLRRLLHRAAARPAPPAATIPGARTLQARPERDARAGLDYRKKGRRVYVEGRLTKRAYESDGEKRTVSRVALSDMILLDAKPNGHGGSSDAAGAVTTALGRGRG